MSKETSKERMHEWIKENSANRTGQSSSSSAQAPKKQSASVSNSAVPNPVKAENDRLKAKLRKLEAQKKAEQEKRQADRKAKEAERDDKAIHDMEHGGEKKPTFTRRFDKTYHLSYMNPHTGEKQPYALHFVIRPSTMADQAAINNQITLYTNRLGKYYEVNNFALVKAFATIKVLGVKLPKAFTDPARLHRLDLLQEVYFDFLAWENKFRGYTMA